MVFMRFRPQLIASLLFRSRKPRTPPATLAPPPLAARRRHTATVTSMAAAPSEDVLRRALAERQAAVDAQAEAVRALKAAGVGASKADVDAAVEALKALKVEAGAAARRLQAAVGSGGGAAREEMRQAVVNTLERKLFYIPSFKIYRGVAGLYDYGPPGCAVKANVLAFWRQHFVLEENMLEVDCPCVTPEIVLKASGHVEKFTDLMVKDEKTGTCYRADHLLKDFCKEKLEKDLTLSPEKAAEFKHTLAVLDDLSAEELGSKLKEYGIVAPDTKNTLSDPYPFNLMFQTSIGPTGLSLGYMRPETAQGIFVNFKDLYYYNGQKLPFAAAQIGQAFRNEISPRQGLLRVREFTLAEIEHFVDPEDKSHPKFVDVADLEFLMFPRELQLSGESAKLMKLGEAVSKGTVNNETLGFFIGRVYLFLTRLGIDKDRLRFRQHLPNEMAHYAADCWDAEIECSYGWIECVGIADRSAYDLRAHSEKSGVPLVAHEKFSKPREVEKLVIVPSKKDLGLAFKGNQKMVVEALEAMSEKEAMDMKAALESKGETNFQVCTLGKDVVITKKMVSISMEKKMEHQRVFTPSVIEPSFGIGRIIYCLFEHSFYTRPSKSEEEQMNVFRFPPIVAPIKCTVFPLVKNQEFDDAAKVIAKALTAAGISHIIDTAGISIGRRYARTDEIGVPFAVTVDSATSVTVRERDSKEQVRVGINEVASVVKQLTEGQSTWADVSSKYPSHVGPQGDQEYGTSKQRLRNYPSVSVILEKVDTIIGIGFLGMKAFVKSADSREWGYYSTKEESYHVAETTMPGRTGFDFNGSSQSFNVLASYLFGKNTTAEQMEMTTPVFTRKGEPSGKKMDMTAPVITKKSADKNQWKMSFVMPSKYGSDLPLPKDPSVTIKEVPSKIVAVAAFSGLVTDDDISQRESRLRQALQKDTQFRVKDDSVVEVAQYNPPFTLPFTRRNEIALEVEQLDIAF